MNLGYLIFNYDFEREKFMNSMELAKKIRLDAIEMVHISNSSHIGAVFSVADIVAVLYAKILKYDIDNPESEDRDYFILSKGHAGAAVYSVLANCGFFDKRNLKTHCANGSILSGHISHKNVLGVEISTGSLGHGGNIGCGIALSKKILKQNNRVYVIMGDGECNEGTVWEMALFAQQYRLNNLCVIVDNNNMQGYGYCKEIMNNDSLADRWRAFGWEVKEIDGHNHMELEKSLMLSGKEFPKCVIANTIKGKGVSFMEHNLAWHYRSPQGDNYINALKEIEGK